MRALVPLLRAIGKSRFWSTCATSSTEGSLSQQNQNLLDQTHLPHEMI